MIPMNLLRPEQTADFVLTGAWSKKAFAEAKTVGATRIAATSEVDGKFQRVPKASELTLEPGAAYVHLTSNETIDGVQFHDFPRTGTTPLVADMSSDLLWRPIDVERFALIYAGAQKNIGPSGVAVVIVRKDLVERGRTDIPKFFRYATHAAENSLYNTPPTFSIYLMRNVLELVKQAGGLSAVEQRNRKKGDALYAAIDARPDFYRCPVERGSRSYMNVVFNLPTPELEAEFVKAAEKAGLVGLKGHRSVGGVRASIYNAVELAWVETLADFMNAFHKGG
jgi:phosphoserine aminotransferase